MCHVPFPGKQNEKRQAKMTNELILLIVSATWDGFLTIFQTCKAVVHSPGCQDEEGETYVCTPCPVGTAQPSGASLLCEPCLEGQYQASRSRVSSVVFRESVLRARWQNFFSSWMLNGWTYKAVHCLKIVVTDWCWDVSIITHASVPSVIATGPSPGQDRSNRLQAMRHWELLRSKGPGSMQSLRRRNHHLGRWETQCGRLRLHSRRGSKNNINKGGVLHHSCAVLCWLRKSCYAMCASSRNKCLVVAWKLPEISGHSIRKGWTLESHYLHPGCGTCNSQDMFVNTACLKHANKQIL